MNFWKYIFGILLLTFCLAGIALLQLPDGNLHIIVCNVGQGDAILTVYRETQILTDGGPEQSVLNCLGKYMPFWDRTIELVISTHPDADHSTGLTDVIKNYNVGSILINPIDPGTSVYEVLRKEVGSRGVPVINPQEGMRLGGGLIYLDILNPSQTFLDGLTPGDVADKLSKYQVSTATNLYSIVYRLSFKNFTGLLLGDIPPEVSDRLAVNSLVQGADYIKVPHHGSTNGMTLNLLKAVMPKIAVISVGKNTWGFPAPAILDMLKTFGVKTLRTDQVGDVEVITDGITSWVR